jgi:hypothetical protein
MVAKQRVKRLDIACGQNKTPGFKGIDMSGDADITHDLFSYPWPIASNSVEEVVANHFVEHIPHYMPDWKGVDGWWMFFDELYRICKKGASVTLTHPFFRNDRAFWDPSHTRFISDANYWYLGKVWRETQGLDHYPVSCNFEIVTIDGGLDDEMMLRNEQAQAHARKYYWNAVGDLTVRLRKV